MYDSSGHFRPVICHTIYSSGHVRHVICHTIAVDMLDMLYMSHDSREHVKHVICNTIAVDMLYVTR